MPRSLARLSASASSHRDLSLAVFITHIAASDFRYTHRSSPPFHPAIILHRLSSGAQRDAAQQRIAGVFIPVRTWPDRMVCSHGWPTGFLADPLGRRFELLDERSETRRHRLRYSVVLDPKPSSNCQQPRSLI